MVGTGGEDPGADLLTAPDPRVPWQVRLPVASSRLVQRPRQLVAAFRKLEVQRLQLVERVHLDLLLGVHRLPALGVQTTVEQYVFLVRQSEPGDVKLVVVVGCGLGVVIGRHNLQVRRTHNVDLTNRNNNFLTLKVGAS